jgi:hypothetical protein
MANDIVLLGNPASIRVRTNTDPLGSIEVTAHLPDSQEVFTIDSSNWETGHVVTFIPTSDAGGGYVTFTVDGYPVDLFKDWNVEVAYLGLSITPTDSVDTLTNSVLLGNAATAIVRLTMNPEGGTHNITAHFPGGVTETFSLSGSNWDTGHTISYIPTLDDSTVTFTSDTYLSGVWSVNVDTLSLVFDSVRYVRYGQTADILVRLSRKPDNNMSITAHIPIVGGETTETFTLNNSNWNIGHTVTFTPTVEISGGIVLFNPGGYPAGSREIELTYVSLVLSGDYTVNRGNTADIIARLDKNPVIPMTINAYYNGSLLSTFVLNSTNWNQGVTTTFLPLNYAIGPEVVTFNPGGYPVSEWDVDTTDLALTINGDDLILYGVSASMTVTLDRDPENTVLISYHRVGGPSLGTITLDSTNWDTGQTVLYLPPSLTTPITVVFDGLGTFSYITANHVLDVVPLPLLLNGTPTTITTNVVSGGNAIVTASFDINPLVDRTITADLPSPVADDTFTLNKFNYFSGHNVVFPVTGTTVVPFTTVGGYPTATWTINVVPISFDFTGSDTSVRWGNPATISVKFDKDPGRNILVTATLPDTTTRQLILNSDNWSSGYDLEFMPLNQVNGGLVTFDCPGVIHGTYTVALTFVVSSITARSSIPFLNTLDFVVKLDKDPQRIMNFTAYYLTQGTTGESSYSFSLDSDNWSDGYEVSFVPRGNYGSITTGTIRVEGIGGYPSTVTHNYTINYISLICSSEGVHYGAGETASITIRSSIDPEVSLPMVPINKYIGMSSFTLNSSNWTGQTIYFVPAAPPALPNNVVPTPSWDNGNTVIFNNPSITPPIPNYPTTEMSFVVLPPYVPVVTSSLSVTTAGDTWFEYQITATNMVAPCSYNATGLPPGLAIDTASGLIYGTVGFDTAGVAAIQVTISATNYGGTGTATLSITSTISLVQLYCSDHENSVNLPFVYHSTITVNRMISCSVAGGPVESGAMTFHAYETALWHNHDGDDYTARCIIKVADDYGSGIRNGTLLANGVVRHTGGWSVFPNSVISRNGVDISSYTPSGATWETSSVRDNAGNVYSLPSGYPSPSSTGLFVYGGVYNRGGGLGVPPTYYVWSQSWTMVAYPGFGGAYDFYTPKDYDGQPTGFVIT